MMIRKGKAQMLPGAWVRGLMMIVVVAAAVLLSACQHGSARPESAPDVRPREVPTDQLPRTVQPSHYDLHLRIDPRQQHFSGEVAVDLNVHQPTALFWLHGQRLDVERVQLRTAGGDIIAAHYRQVDDTGVAEISLEQVYGPGQATLEVAYQADFNRALEGLYRVDEAGESYAFTQFEAISARLAFPGFDEPGFKVPFTVRLTVPQHHTAVANTPALREAAADDGYKTVYFAPSKPIPTYLVAFAVGPFDVVEWEPIPPSPLRERAIPLRGIAVRGKGGQFDYALENTASIVQSLENYFGIPYPYAKLDLLAVPDFSAGAMENVGAITYREVLLLMDEQATPQQIRRYKAVHSHELAHQWFGNLVTPVWWDDIWLNESFATWMGYAALDLRAPEDQFRRDLLESSAEAMVTDSLISARQIRQPILSNHDIASAFDGITYRKGGGVLSMFERYLGFDAFRRGVSQYLQKRSWGNATADDFIAAIAAQAAPGENKKVAAAFQSFLQQPGLPVLESSYNCGTIGKQPIFQVRLTQSRYLPLGSTGSRHPQWKIPACIAYAQDGRRHEACRLLEKPLTTWLFHGECPDWMLPNAQGAGYYRWNQSSAEWTRLLAVAQELSPEEQIKLADSFVAAFHAGGISLTDFLDGAYLLARLPVRQAALLPMKELETLINVWPVDGAQRQRMRDLLRDIYAGPLAHLGLAPQDDYERAELQHGLVRFQALIVEDALLRQALLTQAAAYVDYTPGFSGEPLEQNLGVMDLALEVAVQEWGLPFVEHVYNLLKTHNDPVFRRRVTGALAAAREPAAAARVRQLALDDTLRNNEILSIVFQQVDQVETRAQGWQWLQQEFEALRQRMPVWVHGRLANVGNGFCTVEERAELHGFFAPQVNDLGGGPRALANTLERIDLCLARRAHYQRAYNALTVR